MVQQIYVYRAVWLLLFGVLAIAAWDGASAWSVCSHEISSPKHCSEKEEHSAQRVSNVPAVSRLGTLIERQVEPCSHCLTHSPWGPNSSPHAIVNNLSLAVVASDSHVVAVEFSASNTPVEIYDHGPPGNGNLRYILNSTFRI